MRVKGGTEKPVQACLCYPHSFAQLKAMAQENGWRTVEDITAAVGCGSGCGLCRPYLGADAGNGRDGIRGSAARRGVNHPEFEPQSSRPARTCRSET